jgi:ER-bound oxygenase mpaB/B'/Rubber oxygenase, catalytic domain
MRTELPLSELKAKVRAQATEVPSLYGGVDFECVPERFVTDPNGVSVLAEQARQLEQRHRPAILRDAERLERTLAYTMLGDGVADAYAALTPAHGFRKLVDMVTLACERGLDAVKDAPPELERLIGSMERTPDWIDPKLSAEGARIARVSMAMLTPFMIRGAFIATFSNKYTGLPMVLTGALSRSSAVQRVKETASFFTTATLPGALERFGPGFRAAAMVRVMHAMVRAHLLTRPGRWDVGTYGVPIPQIDQVPAGTMGSLITAGAAARAKRGFDRRERALVEFNRHQCSLLGLPAELLPETPMGILGQMMTYLATLRDGYDDTTNGDLVRATMAAYLPADQSARSRVFDTVERSVSKVFFKHILRMPDTKARQMGVLPGAFDYGMFAAFQAYALPQFMGHLLAARVPGARELADKQLVRRIDQLLVSYGHAEYTTDPERYRAA